VYTPRKNRERPVSGIYCKIFEKKQNIQWTPCRTLFSVTILALVLQHTVRKSVNLWKKLTEPTQTKCRRKSDKSGGVREHYKLYKNRGKISWKCTFFKEQFAKENTWSSEIQGVQEKLCVFTIHCNPSLAYIAVGDHQSSQGNASVQSLLLADHFLYNQ